jgi:hypothetical protein
MSTAGVTHSNTRLSITNQKRQIFAFMSLKYNTVERAFNGVILAV